MLTRPLGRVWVGALGLRATQCPQWEKHWGGSSETGD